MLVGSGVFVGIGVKVGVGLTAHPLIASVIMLRSASHKHVLRSVFCILISSQSDLPQFRRSFLESGQPTCPWLPHHRCREWLSGQ